MEAPTPTPTEKTEATEQTQQEPKAEKKTGEKLLQTQEELLSQLDPVERKKLEAQIGAGGPDSKKQRVKFILNKKDEILTLEKDSVHKKETIFFKHCTGCTIHVKSRSAKILIESCSDSVINLNSIIVTNTVEIWKCNNINLMVDCKASTIQADLCNNLQIQFSSTDLLDRIVWCAVEQLAVGFKIPEEHNLHKLETGYQQMTTEYPDLNREVDQFIIRFLEDKLVQEQIVRLPGGFPTTERESQAFDERKQKNDVKLEQHLRKLIRTTESKLGARAKVGRKEECPCGSTKKYKVCCGKNSPSNEN